MLAHAPSSALAPLLGGALSADAMRDDRGTARARSARGWGGVLVHPLYKAPGPAPEGPTREGPPVPTPPAIHIPRDRSHRAWDPAIPPIETVASGDVVEFDLLDAAGGQLSAAST